MNLAADRHARRDLSGDLGHRAALHRRVVRPRRPQVAHRLRHVGPGGRHRGRDRRRRASRASPAGAALLGIGTAMVYPTLLAAIGDVAHPSWRASSVGVYRLWRDLGYAIGALLAGVTADAFGLPAAMWLVAALTFASGLVVALRMTRDAAPSAVHRRALLRSRRASSRPSSTRWQRTSRVLIVDVRSPEEFACGPRRRAPSTSRSMRSARAASASAARIALIVTVCGKGGGRSDRAARELRARGFKRVRSLCGGTRRLAKTCRGRCLIHGEDSCSS